MAKQFILFDPVTAERKIVTYKLLAGMTGRTVESLKDSKVKGWKLKSLNCYILDVDTPISVYRKLLAKEVIPNEVWRDIPNSRWQVSSYGRYRSKTPRTGKIIYRVPHNTKKSSYMIKIRIGNEGKSCRAHEKVFELFVGEVPKGHVVYHKNGNKYDNRVENLGVITRNKLVEIQATPAQRKPIVQMDKETGEILAEYRSIEAAVDANFTARNTIKRGLEQNIPTIGFIWKYEEQVTDELLYAE
ncbi:HNH endonuclease signature motif containing protein [Niameybacter massiliensis]|uniref:HNH endonuclease signature motif containing protein n=1 Tax=Holtiella tumoricola TaxID=3018743 RepID=A0AA42DJD3_9FIRM|nr:HNH endonuclease signature motif containing protein [Holtiella tumoricola]